ncbi:LOW QUALITY PROTEIN: hypothetical protein BSKO_07563 [Bryopsis sp. KO-2023]|nr:LOW QUALITY PROTEIN: hypothetical protein BSKO_07563 [Bryopsis sp. KO-2023]
MQKNHQKDSIELSQHRCPPNLGNARCGLPTCVFWTETSLYFPESLTAAITQLVRQGVRTLTSIVEVERLPEAMGGRSRSMKRFKIRMECMGAKLLTSLPSPSDQTPLASNHAWLNGKEALAIVTNDEEYHLALQFSNMRKSKQKIVTAPKRDTTKQTKETCIKKCVGCGATQTPQWRVGHNGTTLCNACGVRYRRSKVPALVRKKQKAQQRQKKSDDRGISINQSSC